jgi:carboxyl-terminal processing protease
MNPHKRDQAKQILNPVLRKIAVFATAGLVLISQASANGLKCEHLPELMQAYLSNHYSVQELTPEIKTRTAAQFMKILDPNKSLFLESEVKTLTDSLLPSFESMKKGDCKPIEQVYGSWLAKTQAAEEFAKKTLNKDFKVDESVEFAIDPEKRGSSKNSDEQQKFAKNLIHFQVSSLMLADNTLAKAKENLVKRYELATKRAKDRGMDRMVEYFAEAFATALDPHTSYFSADQMEDFRINMELSLEGIGVSLSSQDGYVVVQEIIPGGSTDRAKALMPKDKIIAVGQDGKKMVSVMDMELNDVVKMIRGKKGSRVKLTVLRQKDQTKTFDVTIVRDKVDIKEQAAKITYETRKVAGKSYKVGVLDLPSFYGGGERGSRSSYADVKRLLEEANKEKVDSLVLDLSRNGGGLLQDAVRISGLFLKKGPVVGTQDTSRNKEILSDRDADTVYSGPLVILISRVSASASEILTGALKDYKRALVVGGDHTFGKGTVQVLNGLPQGLGGMKLTTGMYFLPSGRSTQNTGVDSDIVFPSTLNNDEIGEKNLDYPLPATSIASFLGSDVNEAAGNTKWTPIDKTVVAALSERAKKRISDNKEFKEIQEDIEEQKKNKGMVKLADLRKRTEADKKKKKKDADDIETAEERRAAQMNLPHTQEAVTVSAELAAWLAGGGKLAALESPAAAAKP